MKRLLLVLGMAVALAATAVPAFAEKAMPVPNAIWAHGEIYGTVGTSAHFVDKGPFDTLYNFDGSGLSGQRSISESAPGDKDFNGGRWEVYPVTYTAEGIAMYDTDHDCVVDVELTSAEQVLQAEEDGYLTIASEPAVRFECPVRPNN